MAGRPLFFRRGADAIAVQVRQEDGVTEVEIGERVYRIADLRRDGAGRLQLRLDDGRRLVGVVARDGDTRHVWTPGDTPESLVRVSSLREASAAGDAGGGDLRAPMTGQVTQVLVGAGDAVSEGQTLVVLVAMKMEMRIDAHCDGVVKELRCAVGDNVERGFELAVVEEATA